MGYWPKANNYEVKTAPSGLPVDLDTVKAHLRITSCDEDVLLNLYLETAVQEVERLSNVLTRPAEFEGQYGTFEFDGRTGYDYFVKLERAPFRSVSEVRSWNGTDFTVVDAGDYEVELKRDGYTRIRFDAFGEFNYLTVTGDGPQEPYPIRVDFQAGPADAKDSELKMAVLHYVAWLYDNRGDCAESEMPATVRSQIARHRILDVFG